MLRLTQNKPQPQRFFRHSPLSFRERKTRAIMVYLIANIIKKSRKSAKNFIFLRYVSQIDATKNQHLTQKDASRLPQSVLKVMSYYRYSADFANGEACV